MIKTMDKGIDLSNATSIKPFLKWAGGKFRVINKIRANLPKGKRLIEPFIGSGSVFLNFDFNDFLLADINDVIVTK